MVKVYARPADLQRSLHLANWKWKDWGFSSCSWLCPNIYHKPNDPYFAGIVLWYGPFFLDSTVFDSMFFLRMQQKEVKEWTFEKADRREKKEKSDFLVSFLSSRA